MGRASRPPGPAPPMHHPRNKAFAARFALSPVALVVASLLQPAGVRAQPAGEPMPVLRASPQLREDIPEEVRQQLPTFVEGDRITGRPDLETVVEGDAVLRRGDTVIRAKRLEYHQPDDLARAIGDVRINKAGNIFEGTLLELHVDAFQGFFNQPRYRFLVNDAYGQADRIDFLDENRSVIRNATYTTCQAQPGPSWMPDWILRASRLEIDQEEEVGEARNAVLSFKGVPILPVPALTFPTGDKRKSGVLPPTIGLDNKNGLDLTLPYYWNIAPNRDLTLYPTLMSRRGLDLGAEFRYLESSYTGTARANYMPGDRLRDRDRWGLATQHTQATDVPGLGPTNLSLRLNRVSDDNYWRDFSRNSATLTQRLLANDFNMSWGWDDVRMRVRSLKWQTLQDPFAPIVPPYDRSPQLTATQVKSNLPGGLETTLQADYSRFESDPLITGQPNAHRGYALAQLSRPWQAPGWFFVPRAQLHGRHYEFSQRTASGLNNANVTVPTFSLDGGLVLERDTNYFGRAFLQTLEPRAFYVYTPFREQNNLPNYDSGRNDFNFATIFTENSFGGHDRIADNNLLTVGATSRLLDPDTGAEAAKFAVAQRLRFKDQLVVLPGQEPVSERLSDLLFGASVTLVPQWSVEGTVQYNPKTRRSIRSVLGARWTPGDFRTISAAYRLQRGSSEQIDVGWQWPLSDLFGRRLRETGPGCSGRWYSVGRLNWSLRDRRLVEGILGFEYDAGCYIGRIVVERLQAGTTTANKRILFQLEFLGLSRLGSGALETLKQNIPHYRYLREEAEPPSRFTNYD